MKTNRLLTILLVMAIALSGCAGNDTYTPDTGNGTNNGGSNSGNNDNDGDTGDGTDTNESPGVSDVEVDDEDDHVENSTFSKTVTIVFDGASATVTDDAGVVNSSVSGGGVTIESTEKEIEYVVSGSTTNGYLKIYSDYKFKLSLNSATITNPSGPAINIQSGKRCFVVLTGTSTLTDGSTYSTAPNDEDQKATMFSEGELIFSGTGTVNVKGNNKHGICSDDYVRIRDGATVNVTGAASDGIHTNDAFIMDGGTLSVTCDSDGIEVGEGFVYIQGGTVTVNAGDDGIVASYEDGDTAITPNIYVTGGKVTVNTTAQKGHALKSTGDISVSGGTHTLTTTGVAAKGINADGNGVFSGGNMTITTSGNGMYDTSDKDTSSAAGVKTGDTFGMTGGTLTIRSSGSGGKGINANGSFVMDNGTLSVTTTGSTFTYSSSITSKPKGIKSNNSVTFNGGTCTVSATHEGIEAAKTVTVNGGTVEATAADDAINAKTSRTGAVVINGGYVYAYGAHNSTSSKPGDGIDSNGTITITNGVVIASGGASPDEGFDCDQNAFNITGGVVIGTGGATSNPTNSSGQHAIVYKGSGTLNEYIQLKDPSGNQLLVYQLPRAQSTMTILVSASGIAKSSSYTFTKGGTYSGGTEVFKGYYTGGTYSNGTGVTISTGTSAYTSYGSSSGGGNTGGPGGGRP